ncbi:hypothetical protein FIBSPDRAFT_336547 [Athelia psychrophila]|uniref:Uncharacterized protein n=1 Tax=Athelia psychrophila TaxID=1759441 RepID=A0A166Q8B5_9AGAM|nr:hypothetical protein FIBSPDRAFT_336547 [Fibularhizoctonia sp. CBS 109695]
MLATDAFKAYTSATGGVFDQATGLLQLTPDQFSNLQSLFFLIGDSTFELTANAQIFPRSLNSGLGGSADGIYLIAADVSALLALFGIVKGWMLTTNCRSVPPAVVVSTSSTGTRSWSASTACTTPRTRRLGSPPPPTHMTLVTRLGTTRRISVGLCERAGSFDIRYQMHQSDSFRGLSFS